METQTNRHRNYELLNLIGYGLAKFDSKFLHELGFETKVAFYRYCVDFGVADTTGTVKNRMDMFDPFFPQSRRAGWHQRMEDYRHRKAYIDAQFGELPAQEFAAMVKLFVTNGGVPEASSLNVQPIVRSRFKQLQETGLQAETYFQEHFESIEKFRGGTLDDARLLGDGYDFQVNLSASWHLAEVKGIRARQGDFRLTEREYLTAREYGSDYSVVVVMNLDDAPKFLQLEDPARSLKFRKTTVSTKATFEYRSEVVAI